MTELFLRLFNVSVTAGWIVLAVLLLRPLLKKAPKWICCLLWGIVALRLVMPVSVESVLSLIPSPEVIPRDIGEVGTPAIYSGIPAVNSAVNPLLTQYAAAGGTELDKLLSAAAAFWAGGVTALSVYSAFTWLRLHRQVRANIYWRDNIYICDSIGSPFIFGLLRPKIYVPSGLREDQLQYVLAHENAHLRRRDHWWKPLGFLLLTVYWFNPLLWVSYVLLCQDIEQACDEKVVSTLDISGKKAYSMALLDCSARRRMIMACPVAFGEVSVKTRIKSVLTYKKPGFWILLASVAVCVAASVCFLTDPVPCAHEYGDVEVRAATCSQKGAQSHTCLHCSHSYTSYTDKLPHSYDGGVTAVSATCTQTGAVVYTCAGCGREKKETVAKLAHIPGELRILREPTCVQTGKVETRCIGCDRVCTTQILDATQEHILVEEVLREATCASFGEGIRKCQLCGYTEGIGYEKPAHQYKEIGWHPSTCVERGHITKECTECGHRTKDILPLAEEHDWYTSVFPGGSRWCWDCDAYEEGTSVSDDDYSLIEPYSPKDAYGEVVFPVIRWDPYP